MPNLIGWSCSTKKFFCISVSKKVFGKVVRIAIKDTSHKHKDDFINNLINEIIENKKLPNEKSVVDYLQKHLFL